MADASDSRNIEKLHCSVCLEMFDRPKLLPCYHSFCTPCLDTYVNINRQGKKFSCPLCRTDIDIPEGGVSRFQSNFYIETSASKQEGEDIACDVCGPKAKATHRCTDCEENFCQNCSDTHLKMKISRNHQLIEIVSVEPTLKRKIVSRVFCSEHPNEELKFVCKQCADKLLCIDCKLTEHENHTTKHISSEAKSAREKLTSLINGSQLDTKIHNLDESLSQMAKYTNSLEENLKTDIQVMRLQESSLQKMIAEIAEDKEHTLRDMYEKEIERNETERLLLDKERVSSQSLKENIRLLVEHESDIHLLKRSASLCEMLQQVCPTTERVSVKEFESNCFIPGDLKRDSLADMFGSVLPQSSALSTSKTRPVLKGKENLKLVSEFKLPLSAEVSGIAPVGENKAWVSFWSKPNIYLVKRDGAIERTVDVGCGCDYITVDKDLTCIVTCMIQRCVKRVTESGKITTLVSGLDMVPHGVACQANKDTYEVLIACTSEESYHANSGYVRRDTANLPRLAPEIQAPLRVAVNPSTSNIFIADYVNKRVTKHDPEGKLLSEYKEPTQTTCIYVYDDKHVILCNDYSDVRLVNIDSNQTYILIRDIERCSVAVDESNFLWFGQWGSVKVYEIH